MKHQFDQHHLKSILLHIDSIETVKKFKRINEKCKGVSDMVTTFTKRRLSELSEKHEQVIPDDLFFIFPNIERIKCTENDLFTHQSILEKISFIDLEIEDEMKWREKNSISTKFKRKFSDVEETQNSRCPPFLPRENSPTLPFPSMFSKG